MGGLDGHRLSAGQPQPFDAQHPAAGGDVQQSGEPVVRRDIADVQQLGGRLQALGPHVLRIGGQLQGLGNLGLGDKGALALDALQPALDHQLLEGLTHRRARGVELRREGAFGRYRVPGGRVSVISSKCRLSR